MGKDTSSGRNKSEREKIGYWVKSRTMERLARGNDVAAHYWLGCELSRRREWRETFERADVDLAEACTHLAACEQAGHVEGILRLAALHTRIGDVPGYDRRRALALTEQAAKLGSRTATRVLEQTFLHGGDIDTLLSDAIKVPDPDMTRAQFTDSGYLRDPSNKAAAPSVPTTADGP